MEIEPCEHLDDAAEIYVCDFCQEDVCFDCTICSIKEGLCCKFKTNWLNVDKFYWLGKYYKRVVNTHFIPDDNKSESH